MILLYHLESTGKTKNRQPPPKGGRLSTV